jgi:lysophospholipase L1-like esterase
MGDWSNRKTGTVNMVNLSNLIRGKHERKIKNNPDYVNAFAATMKLLQEKNIKVILLYLPYVDLLEFNDPKRDATREIIRQYAGLNPNVYFLDYTQPLSDQHQWYFDPNHLNPMGQAAATELLIKDIKALRESNNK